MAVKVKITQHTPIMFDYGTKHRIERRFQSEPDGSGFRWIVYELQPITDGIHPITGQKTGMKEIWMIKNVAMSKEEAHSMATKLAGG